MSMTTLTKHSQTPASLFLAWRFKLLEEVTVVVKEIFFKEAQTIFRQEVAPTGARNAPISQCNFVYKLPLPW